MDADNRFRVSETGFSARFLFLLFSVFALAIPPLRAADTKLLLRKAVILIAPFENLSRAKDMIDYEMNGTDPNKPKRTFRVDRYSEAPRSVLEDIFVSFDGVQVAERQRLDQLLIEGEFGRVSGLVDPDKAVALGKMLGATAVVMGTIQDISTAQRKFSGYGIQTETTVLTAAVRVRVIDVATGKIPVSKVFKGSTAKMASSAGSNSHSDEPFVAIESALEKVREDEDIQRAIYGTASENKSAGVAGSFSRAQEVEVEFAPKPDNTDVEVDGKYMGGSPLKLKLPVGGEVKVKLAKAGFKTKQLTIAPQAKLRITTELELEEKK